MTTDQLDLISELITEHILDYANENGGIENMPLYTSEEINKIEDDLFNDVLNWLYFSR